MTIISEQGEKDHDNLAGWRRRLKNRVEIIVIKEGGKVGRIKSLGYLVFYSIIVKIAKLKKKYGRLQSTYLKR